MPESTNASLGVIHLHLHEILDRASIPGGGTLAERIETLVAQRDGLWAEVEAKRKRPTRDRLLEMLDEDRDEVLMMLADEALDRGAEGEAKGWGWLAANHKWPSSTMRKHKKHWEWWQEDDELLASHALPLDLIRVAEGQWLTHRTWATCGAALQAVVDVIAQGRWQPEPKKVFRLQGNPTLPDPSLCPHEFHGGLCCFCGTARSESPIQGDDDAQQG